MIVCLLIEQMNYDGIDIRTVKNHQLKTMFIFDTNSWSTYINDNNWKAFISGPMLHTSTNIWCILLHKDIHPIQFAQKDFKLCRRWILSATQITNWQYITFFFVLLQQSHLYEKFISDNLLDRLLYWSSLSSINLERTIKTIGLQFFMPTSFVFDKSLFNTLIFFFLYLIVSENKSKRANFVWFVYRLYLVMCWERLLMIGLYHFYILTHLDEL